MDLNASLRPRNVYRFGPFEADWEEYQLRSGTRTIKLERIPLELLFLLLANEGKLASREQITAALWKDDSFLDTERSINTAIRKIRKVLGDDPRCPRYIETVVGKGYRFVAPLLTTNVDEKLRAELPTPLPSRSDNSDLSEIKLKDFQVEFTAEGPVLSCNVSVGELPLGRLPILLLLLPPNVAYPLKQHDRFLLNMHGVELGLTSKAERALNAVCLSVLQRGMRTRVTDLALPAEQGGGVELQQAVSAAITKSAAQPGHD